MPTCLFASSDVLDQVKMLLLKSTTIVDNRTPDTRNSFQPPETKELRCRAIGGFLGQSINNQIGFRRLIHWRTQSFEALKVFLAIKSDERRMNFSLLRSPQSVLITTNERSECDKISVKPEFRDVLNDTSKMVKVVRLI
jgi:hypothetical protein